MAASGGPRASAHLGHTLRSVLVTPTDGFHGILRQRARRAAKGARPAEGIAPYVLTALGGAATMLLWLKLGSLIGTRQVGAAEFRWSYVIVACVGAAVFALLAQGLWGFTGALALRPAASAPEPSELRLIWGAAAFPQVVTVFLLLPLDLLIVGSDTFTSTRLSDPVATGWAALSIALTISVAVWSLFLLYRGLRVVTGDGIGSALAGVAVAIASAGIVAAAAIVGLASISGSTA